jgi:hypothetical protein
MSDREEYFQEFLEHRGVETPCESCNGYGTRWYNNTSTWLRGFGGAKITRDVCDTCWGSGDKDKKWTDIRAMELTKSQEIKSRALTLFADSFKTSMDILQPALNELCDELDKLGRGRKVRSRFFYELVSVLSKTIRGGMKGK